MNDLVVKKVDLCGDVIMAAQDKDGQVWAGVKWEMKERKSAKM